MGLFDIFKKSAPSHAEKVSKAYRCYKPDMVGMLFPGGEKQAGNIILSLAKVYGLNTDSCDAMMYYKILTTYTDVLIRKVITQSTDEHILMSLQVKHQELIKNKDVAKKALAYVTLNMKNNEFTLDSDKSLSDLDFMVDLYTQMEETASQNAEAETENLDDPDYGLQPEKPVYTQGLAGSQRYLNGLKTALGEPLTWTRLGSTSAEGINGLIDIYESKLPSGKPYKTLYVNMYGSSNSTKVPKGFSK